MSRPVNRANLQWLKSRFGPLVRLDEPMAKHTSLKVGGRAGIYVTPTDTAQLLELIQWAQTEEIRFWVVGKGTNLLVSDKGLNGMVIRLSGCLSRVDIMEPSDPIVRIKAGAGASLAALCRICLSGGLAGFNFALGIPGTVGGALRTNAGASGGCMADGLKSVEILSLSGKDREAGIQTLKVREMGFGYRSCALEDDVLFLSANFETIKADRDQLKKHARQLIMKRKKSQPTYPSAGCFFKNPQPGISAGELIDKAGLKGKRIGSAMVSEVHANFIVNTGGAMAAQLYDLSKKVAGEVKKRFNIVLEPEVIFLGEFP